MSNVDDAIGALRTVLIVEDDAEDAEVLARFVGDAFPGVERLISSRDLAAALERLASEPIDLVLTDLALPDAEGPELVAALRSRRVDVPVLVITHREDTGSALACIDAGAQDYLYKADVGSRLLRRTVLNALERHQIQALRDRTTGLERELAAVFRYAGEAILVWNLDGELLTWNPAAERLYGFPVEPERKIHVEELVPEELRSWFRLAHDRLRKGEALPVIRTIRQRLEGHEIEVEERLFPIRDPHGEVIRIASLVRDLTEISRLHHATNFLSASRSRTDSDGFPPTASPPMQAVYDAANLVAADGNATVLLLGETGVGKGWLARHVHRRSPRAGKPFLSINCAGLPPSLVESELFGHEKGAFTGAIAQKRGLVEAAEGGTLFLDEIGELPLALQTDLLSFLDTRVFRRVGGTRTLTADVRLVVATNVDLTQAVVEKTFRADLYYRLNVFPIRLPALRERREDLIALATSILSELAPRAGKPDATLAEAALRCLARYDWPGNVRELRNVLERALILSRGETIRVEHLPVEVRTGERPPGPGQDSRRLADVEREHVLLILEESGGNRTRAAQILGISRATLRRKIGEESP